jgi:hypothetical protein
MFRRILYFSVLCFLILSGCTKTTVELPAPDILYSDVAEAVMLSEMIELTSEELQNLVGIDPEDYVEFAAYQAGWGTSADEIIIIQAVDSSKAHDIEAKLKERVEHKRKSAESYLTENLPIIDAAIVRCDGNTVSMLITENIDAANSVYEKFYK